MPGMAANPIIFEHIKLPENQYRMHYLEWIIPEKKESLKDYVKRLILGIKHENPIVVGVSFGGIIVQEIAKIIKVKKIVVISSVKTKYELPRRMVLAKYTGLHRLIPTSLVYKLDVIVKYAYGDTVVKRLNLYDKYLSVRDKYYLDWAIDKVIRWDQQQALPNTVHIHGENDMVFPFAHIKGCVSVKGGTHVMIINKYKWFNENLPGLFED
jgi:pimeloyl-ACP methyl ester carboxylesterase